ncbi:hypothetical protein DTO013E5_9575 [Penicillium roqueforti]|nr:hypothetical protein DTO012A1_9681 [Penicillium roqueforti]KAI2739913.1 hypothetical protein DTO013F2_9223 [Penicillium roqueforti]KAI2768208.1 hypothetical protein DTO012A8_6573 [Penicillium roqueforti]KAI3063771.1 hypothetical protein CBS147339_9566 [Penicillium roqueforti]KAI3098099.1 hypothetical protein CBS147338_4484 [Penicillium roqueforti]
MAAKTLKPTIQLPEVIQRLRHQRRSNASTEKASGVAEALPITERSPRQHPTQRVEGIITSIYAEMSRMQHEQILMVQFRDNMLRAYRNENASLEEQNRSLLEHVKSLQRENCSLELKHNKLMSEWAKERLQYPEQPDGKRP